MVTTHHGDANDSGCQPARAQQNKKHRGGTILADKMSIMNSICQKQKTCKLYCPKTLMLNSTK